MSSLEIAERTGKRHDNVMADVRTQLGGLLGEGGLLRFQASYRNAQNKEQPCFNLPRRETLILVSGYSVELRAAIIDRWQELEAQQAPAIPNFANPAEAARAWAAEYELKLVAQELVKLLEPKAAIGEQVANVSRTLNETVKRLCKNVNRGQVHKTLASLARYLSVNVCN